MHRSGTSALAGALSNMGVNFGPEEKLFGSDEDVNAKGFWEHRDIVILNEQLLTILGSSWDDFRQIDRSLFASDQVTEIRDKILNILQRDFSGEELWGLKDPRICKLLPFWLDIFREFNSKPVFTLIFRHPDEVSHSLGKRDGTTKEKSLALWLSYYFSAEEYSQPYPRCFITYDDLLKNWRIIIDKVTSCSEVVLQINQTQEGIIDKFLSPELRHSNICNSEISATDLPGEVYQEAIRLSNGASDDKNIRERFESIKNTFSTALNLFSSMVFDQDSAWNEIVELRQKLSNLMIEFEKLQESYQQKEEAYKQKEKSYQQKEKSYQQKEEAYKQMEESYQQKEEAYKQMEESYQQKEEAYKQMENAYKHAHAAYEHDHEELEKIKSNLLWKFMMRWKKIFGIEK